MHVVPWPYIKYNVLYYPYVRGVYRTILIGVSSYGFRVNPQYYSLQMRYIPSINKAIVVDIACMYQYFPPSIQFAGINIKWVSQATIVRC